MDTSHVVYVAYGHVIERALRIITSNSQIAEIAVETFEMIFDENRF